VRRDTVVASHGAVSRALRSLVLEIPKDKVANLEVPQDRIMIVRAGHIEWL
jgi:probable phosphoglycerate mutase